MLKPQQARHDVPGIALQREISLLLFIRKSDIPPPLSYSHLTKLYK